MSESPPPRRRPLTLNQHQRKPPSAPISSPSISIIMALKLTPWREIQVLKHYIPAHNLIPNTSLQHKPLLIYKSVFPSNTSVSQIESHFNAIGVVKPQWRYTMSCSLSEIQLHLLETATNISQVRLFPLPQHIPRSPRDRSRASETVFRT